MSWPEQVATMPLHLHSPPRHKSLAMAGTIMATKTKKLSIDNILTLPQLAPDQLEVGSANGPVGDLDCQALTAAASALADCQLVCQ